MLLLRSGYLELYWSGITNLIGPLQGFSTGKYWDGADSFLKHFVLIGWSLDRSNLSIIHFHLIIAHFWNDVFWLMSFSNFILHLHSLYKVIYGVKQLIISTVLWILSWNLPEGRFISGIDKSSSQWCVLM